MEFIMKQFDSYPVNKYQKSLWVTKLSKLQQKILIEYIYDGHIRDNKYIKYLRYDDIIDILEGRIKGIMVIRPQSYDQISMLTKYDFMFSQPDDLEDESYFYRDNDGFAVSGSGDDLWVKVTNKLLNELRIYIQKNDIDEYTIWH